MHFMETKRCLAYLSEHWKRLLKPILPYTCLLLYVIVGATVLYTVDQTLTVKGNTTSCVDDRGFSDALLYVLTVCTTIGYGTIPACSGWIKLLTAFLALIGIPLFLIVLNEIGKITCSFLNMAYKASKRYKQGVTRYLLLPNNNNNNNNNKSIDTNARIKSDDDKHACLPISLSIFLTLLWSAVCAFYFNWLERWSFGDALFFSFINLVTMGFGGFAPTDQSLMKLCFGIVLLALGMSLVSTTISTVQLNVQVLMDKIHEDIEREFQEKLEFEADNQFMAKLDDEETPEEIVARLIKENGANFLASVMPKSQLDQVVGEAAKRSSMESTMSQTDPKKPKQSKPIQKDQDTQAETEKRNKESQCQIAIDQQSKEIQCDFERKDTFSQTEDNAVPKFYTDTFTETQQSTRTVALQTPKTWPK